MTYNPWADALIRFPGIHIERCDLGTAHGAWVPSQRVILLDQGLDRVQLRCSLAHEIAHIDLRHVSTDLSWFDQRAERDADNLAAKRLIPVDDLATVARCNEWDYHQTARDLNVTVATLRTRVDQLTSEQRATALDQRQRIEVAA